MNQQKPVIAIAGPTASGKSAVALSLAQRIGGEIISADSVQVYKKLNIGSAKPTQEEQRLVPHHLIDILEPWEQYNAASFCQQALAAIDDVQQRGKYPILCGGTGFYLRSVLYDLDFSDTPPDFALRAQLEAEDAQKVYQKLMALAPQEAQRLHPHDKKRVVRALEIAQAGMKKGTFRTQHRRFDFYQYCLDMPREKLYERIDMRVDMMLKMGFLQEVETLLQDTRITAQTHSMQSIGYRQLCNVVQGDCTLEDAISQIKQQTRRFAKRQLTWFRHEAEVRFLDMCALQTTDQAADAIVTQVKSDSLQ